MLNLAQILSYYPTELQISHKEHILREYLQYHILKYVFNSPYASKLRFIGGTALRLIYGNSRFSEDIDFDNDWTLTFEDFNNLAEHIKKSLELQRLSVYIRTIKKWAFHCNINFPEILYNNALSPMKTQTILIQIDTVSQWYVYQASNHFLNKFDVQANILTVSPELLLAQKLYTAFTRKRMKGRDFFDIVFLLWKTQKPDYWYLKQKIWISDAQKLKSYLLQRSEWVDFVQLQKDVAPFLFDPNNQSVALFPQIIEQTEFQNQ